MHMHTQQSKRVQMLDEILVARYLETLLKTSHASQQLLYL